MGKKKDMTARMGNEISFFMHNPIIDNHVVSDSCLSQKHKTGHIGRHLAVTSARVSSGNVEDAQHDRVNILNDF